MKNLRALTEKMIAGTAELPRANVLFGPEVPPVRERESLYLCSTVRRHAAAVGSSYYFSAESSRI